MTHTQSLPQATFAARRSRSVPLAARLPVGDPVQAGACLIQTLTTTG